MMPPRERPLLLRAPLVRAVLDGHKTMTRRPVKGLAPQARFMPDLNAAIVEAHKKNGCPYGAPGDRLWVRENGWLDLEERRLFIYEATPRVGIDATLSGPVTERQFDTSGRIPPKESWKHVPSIHMPRWACRLVLDVVDVRVEPLQDIDGEEAVMEGSWYEQFPHGVTSDLARDIFADAWSATYRLEDRGWDANPWVWAITFQKVSP